MPMNERDAVGTAVLKSIRLAEVVTERYAGETMLVIEGVIDHPRARRGEQVRTVELLCRTENTVQKVITEEEHVANAINQLKIVLGPDVDPFKYLDDVIGEKPLPAERVLLRWREVYTRSFRNARTWFSWCGRAEEVFPVTKSNLVVLEPGVYYLHWTDGGKSLAAVGILEDGRRWYAPVNWTGKEPIGVASCNWDIVVGVERVMG